MFTFLKGNLLDAKTEALINTVNTVGVMGKGIALQFKEKFPTNFKFYKKACTDKKVSIGKMFVTINDLWSPKYIINFPTKKHWRGKSKLEYIELGLKDLKKVIRENNISSISIPPLGCGNGGLDWETVKKLIIETFQDLKEIDFQIYEPSNIVYSTKRKIKSNKQPTLTPARVMLLEAMRSYTLLGYDLSVLEVQKLAYLLQRLGEPLRLNFNKAHYGPYAHNLTFVLQNLDGYYLKGMKYKEAKPFDKLTLIAERFEELSNFVTTKLTKAQKERLQLLLEIIRGFESPLGMELLATVDYLLFMTKDKLTLEEIIIQIQNWNSRKKQLMKPHYIKVAHQQLANYHTHLYI